MKKAFLICPVRGHDPSETRQVVERLESEGWAVHWPPRDTNQDDATGYNICSENLAAVRAADVVFVIWDGQSQGCLFDLGMAFALGKPVRVIGLPEPTEGKSFQNMIREWER
jgi:nucleoside 2-deoxyribosyltransferase